MRACKFDCVVQTAASALESMAFDVCSIGASSSGEAGERPRGRCGAGCCRCEARCGEGGQAQQGPHRSSFLRGPLLLVVAWLRSHLTFVVCACCYSLLTVVRLGWVGQVLSSVCDSIRRNRRPLPLPPPLRPPLPWLPKPSRLHKPPLPLLPASAPLRVRCNQSVLLPFWVFFSSVVLSLGVRSSMERSSSFRAAFAFLLFRVVAGSIPAAPAKTFSSYHFCDFFASTAIEGAHGWLMSLMRAVVEAAVAVIAPTAEQVATDLAHFALFLDSDLARMLAAKWIDLGKSPATHLV